MLSLLFQDTWLPFHKPQQHARLQKEFSNQEETEALKRQDKQRQLAGEEHTEQEAAMMLAIPYTFRNKYPSV